MDRETQEQLLRAQIMSYAALVNTLKATNSIDVAALLERLQGFAEYMKEKGEPIAAQMLIAQAAALGAETSPEAAIAQILH